MTFDAADRNAPETIVLGDGRRLSFAQYGDPRGQPAVLLPWHAGIASARAGWLTQAARECGFRMVAPDRPGMGESDFKLGRTLLGWAADVAELADYLGMRRFGVAGTSGGGPYVLAAAYALGDRLDFAADLAGWGPVEEAGRTPSSRRTERALFWLADHVPILARPGFHDAGAGGARRSGDGYWKSMNRRTRRRRQGDAGRSGGDRIHGGQPVRIFPAGRARPDTGCFADLPGMGFQRRNRSRHPGAFLSRHHRPDSAVRLQPISGAYGAGGDADRLRGRGASMPVKRAGEIVRFLGAVN